MRRSSSRGTASRSSRRPSRRWGRNGESGCTSSCSGRCPRITSSRPRSRRRRDREGAALGLIKELVLLPAAPLRFTVWVADKVAEEAERKEFSPAAGVQKIDEIEEK